MHFADLLVLVYENWKYTRYVNSYVEICSSLWSWLKYFMMHYPCLNFFWDNPYYWLMTLMWPIVIGVRICKSLLHDRMAPLRIFSKSVKLNSNRLNRQNFYSAIYQVVILDLVGYTHFITVCKIWVTCVN